MEYYKIEKDYSPHITGKRDGGYAVEIRDKTSFCSDLDKKLWKDFFTQDIKNGKERCSWGAYAIFDSQLLNAPFRLYLTGRRVKQLDFMTLAPYVRALQFLVSDKVYNIISKFKLQAHNAIPVNIDTFEQKYYLLGFPTVGFDYYNFSKCTFYNYISGKQETFESKDIYSQLFINGRVETILIKLNTKFEVDIINVLGATFFSSDIIEIFEREKITGYIKCKERLEN